MPPFALLSPENMYALVGEPTFGRGFDYFKRGHVVSCVQVGAEIEGVVQGSERYRVRLRATGGRLDASCTCPVGGLCKHAVAVVLLAVHDGLSLPEPKPRAAQVAENLGLATADKLAPDAGFASRQALEDWAVEREVAHALNVSAETLLPAIPADLAQRYGLRYILARIAVRDVAVRSNAARLIGVRALEAVVCGAAVAALERAAEDVRVGIEEELARPTHHEDAQLAPLWTRLLDARRTVRLKAGPRSRAARMHGAWRFDAAWSAITWREPERVVRGGIDYSSAPLTTQLQMPGGVGARLECTCGARDGHCTHALALIDATLDRLAGTREEARVLAEELLRPGWARLLRELDALEVESTRPPPEIEVWWRIDREMGEMTLSPIVRKRLKRGTLSAGTRPTVAKLLDEHADSLSDVDRKIADALAAWAGNARNSGYPWRAFAALVGHPRVVTEWSDEPVEVKRIALGFTALPAGDEIAIEPSIEGARMNPGVLGELIAAYGPGEPLVLEEPERKRCLLVEISDDARQLWRLLSRHGAVFPPESHALLLERLSRLERRLPLSVPSTLKGKQLVSDAITVARLRLLPEVALELELMVRPGPGAPLYPPGGGPRDVMLLRDGERGYVRRELDAEPDRARAMLAGLPMASAQEGPPYCFRMDDPDEAIHLVAALQQPRTGLEVEWLDAKQRVVSTVGAEALRVNVERKRDWFGVTGELKIEAGRLELAVLLDAARRQQRYVRVDAERWVELSETLRQRLLAVADRTFAARGERGVRLELSPGAAPAIQALSDAGATVAAAPDWQQLTTRLVASSKLAPRPPATLDATLRDYQIEGHAWLSRVAAWGAGACLADDMGLGKTVQAIAVLLDRARTGPALVIAPTSVADNWVHELARFAPSLSPVRYASEPDRARALARLRKKDVVIASYGLLVRDADLLASTRFATLVLDEAQALKNPSTRRARAARKLDAEFRLALSGTPFENHLGELWSVFAIIFPGLLGSWEQFRERFAGPIERAKDADTRDALSRVLRPFLLRRTKQEVARELPARIEIEVPVALSHDERELYETARLAAVAELDKKGKKLREEQRRFQVLAALTRLRLLASHPRLYDGQSAIASSKLKRLLELLDELRREGHRALVFSQFTSHLALVREAIDAAGHKWLYLDGETPAAQRTKRIAAFQAGEAEVFLISLKAGGTGINLTAADYVIHLDPWWNPAVEDQATDRAHRIGQTKPVTVYRLIARGTIEEQILAMHHDKRALVAGVLDGSDVAGRLTTQDLLALLSATQGVEATLDDDADEDEDDGASSAAPPGPSPPGDGKPRASSVAPSIDPEVLARADIRDIRSARRRTRR